MHKFYHADRNSSLLEGQNIRLDKNGLSKFGAEYWPMISQRNIDSMNETQLREFYLEEIRKEKIFANYASRLQSMFDANSIQEAIWFAELIIPVPKKPIPIIEIYADRFWSLDMNWLDYKCDQKQSIAYYRNYWYAEISNHSPEQGERKPPKIEVLIALPAKAGNIVHYVNS
ncbi:MAG: hypothetical protein GKR94_26625 [Gammaproteobacteria bacterium]|nr:hypothetical protein [Gammaproteobacteria bacterium]